MSGITISTPRSSASGNIIPASIKIMSSPVRNTSMFIPNSPSPPKGIAKREGLFNAARILVRDPQSYHKATYEIEEADDVEEVDEREDGEEWAVDQFGLIGSSGGTKQRSPPRL